MLKRLNETRRGFGNETSNVAMLLHNGRGRAHPAIDFEYPCEIIKAYPR